MPLLDRTQDRRRERRPEGVGRPPHWVDDALMAGLGAFAAWLLLRSRDPINARRLAGGPVGMSPFRGRGAAQGSRTLADRSAARKRHPMLDAFDEMVDGGEFVELEQPAGGWPPVLAGAVEPAGMRSHVSERDAGNSTEWTSAPPR